VEDSGSADPAPPRRPASNRHAAPGGGGGGGGEDGGDGGGGDGGDDGEQCWWLLRAFLDYACDGTLDETVFPAAGRVGAGGFSDPEVAELPRRAPGNELAKYSQVLGHAAGERCPEQHGARGV
jgi:hypothetical protein